MTFLARTATNIEDLLRESEKPINDELLPNLSKNPAYNPKFRDFFSVPTREGGLSIFKPDHCLKENELSIQLTSPLSLSRFEAELKQQQIIHEIKKRERACYQIKEDEY